VHSTGLTRWLNWIPRSELEGPHSLPPQDEETSMADPSNQCPDMEETDDSGTDSETEQLKWKSRRCRYRHTICTDKPPRYIRIMLQNLQQLPINGQADRSTQLMANIRDYKPDVVLLNDVGLRWRNITAHHQWQERTRTSLPPHKSKFSYNKHGSNTTKVQWGGTGVLLLDQARHRTHGPMGADPENLGGWTWARIQGRDGHHV
jgi:hypothetical protein